MSSGGFQLCSVLSPAARMRALAQMRDSAQREPFDVLVVGGGVVGGGVALDAASRGLSVALIEARDYASGTSSRSSKLIHGGLRYLEQLELHLVREALVERNLMLERLCPHLVRPVSFLYPLRHRGWERPYLAAGLALYDTLALGRGRSRSLPHHRHLTPGAVASLCPALRDDAHLGGVRYWDAQVDDARHTLTVLRTAAQLGAQVANRVQAVAFLRRGEQVEGVCARDLESGRELAVHARRVICAAGVWTPELQRLAAVPAAVSVRAAKGIHLTVPRACIRSAVGLILRTERSVLFVIPWGAHWLIGTTDTDWPFAKASPAASAADIRYLLEHLNPVLRRPLRASDIESVYAGLRPLIAGDGGPTSALSREHAVASPAPGLTVVAGGKYTTYRVMAKAAVDRAVRDLPGSVPPSCTERLPLIGADGWPALWHRAARIARESGLSVSRTERLLRRYGSLTADLLDLIATDPSLARLLPGSGADGYLEAEVAYAVSAEGALHLEDVLQRRTRIALEVRDRGVDAAARAAELLAARLGWDDARRGAEVRNYRRRVAAEQAAERLADDASAAQALGAAAEIVPSAGSLPAR